MATPADFNNKAWLDALNQGVDRVVKEHALGKELTAKRMEFQTQAALSLFSRSEIAHMFIVAVNRLAGHNTNV